MQRQREKKHQFGVLSGGSSFWKGEVMCIKKGGNIRKVGGKKQRIISETESLDLHTDN